MEEKPHIQEAKAVTTIRVSNSSTNDQTEKTDGTAMNVIVLPVNTQESLGSNDENLQRWKARLDSQKVDTQPATQTTGDNFTTIAIVKRRAPPTATVTQGSSTTSQEESEVEQSHQGEIKRKSVDTQPPVIRKQTESAVMTIKAPAKIQQPTVKVEVKPIETVKEVQTESIPTELSIVTAEKPAEPKPEEVPKPIANLTVASAKEEEESGGSSFASAISEQPTNWYSPPSPAKTDAIDMPPLSPTSTDAGVKSWGLVPGKLNLSSYPTAAGVASTLRCTPQ